MKKNNRPEFYRGDVVWAINTTATGRIQKNNRPYVIISNNKANKYSSVITAIPLTTKHKKTLPTHYVFKMNGKINVAMAEQIVNLNVSDISNIETTLDDYDLEQIEKRVKIQLDLKGE